MAAESVAERKGEIAAARASAALRAATGPNHQAVDAAYGGFALDSREGYRAFLTAHARVLPLAERLLDPGALVPGWIGRTDALFADLAALGAPVPPDLDFRPSDDAATRWGAIYVIEGSRLGGAFLARSVPPELPCAYLGARHGPGAWRSLLERLDEAVVGPAAIAEAAIGARAMFEAYGAAARIAA